MVDRARARFRRLARRIRRLERREVSAFRRWTEDTDNLVHLTALALVPLLVGIVTAVSDALVELSFLLFPPIASGAYTLFADPEGRYASPRRFVAGLTLGALCGWAALLTISANATPQTATPATAALSIFLVGALTWAFGVEEPAAFSTALLVLVADRAPPEAYVVSVFVFGSLVAGVFHVWRDRFYERRARYLYSAVRADDHVLVPMRGETTAETATFAARLAAAHQAGKVVLLDVIDDDPPDGSDADARTTERRAGEAADRLEAEASRIRDRFGVHSEVLVATGDPARATLDAAQDVNCDLVVTPYEEVDGLLSSFARSVFRGPLDAVVFQSATGADTWQRVLVLVSRPGDSAHAMVDFATRLAGRTGTVSVCTCIDAESERRRAETRLANIVETVDGPIETRVARGRLGAFIDANAGSYDLLVLGASRDRSAASRFVSPPTFERLRNVPCDVAVVDRGPR